jgi:hypothetical protein
VLGHPANQRPNVQISDRAEHGHMFSVPAAINPIYDHGTAKLAQNTATERPNSPQDRQKPAWTRIVSSEAKKRPQNGTCATACQIGRFPVRTMVPLNGRKSDQERNARPYSLSAVTLFAWIWILKVDKNRLGGGRRLEIALGSERACPSPGCVIRPQPTTQ